MKYEYGQWYWLQELNDFDKRLTSPTLFDKNPYIIYIFEIFKITKFLGLSTFRYSEQDLKGKR